MTAKKTTKTKKNWKTTNDMTAAEKRALQAKLDDVLQDTISKVAALGYDLYEIEPQVRITNNIRRVGSANSTNGASLRKATSSMGRPLEKWSKAPKFRISISTHECASDEDIADTIFHEVIHCIPGCFNHGKHFKHAASRVNKAYGTNVTTSKSSESAQSAGSMTEAEARDLITSHIGGTVRIRTKEMTFSGFNGRPKKCCDLVDANGGQYVCDAISCAFGLGLME